MTVATSTSRVAYNCNGSTVAFAFLFGVRETSEIEVILTDSSGVETVLTETTHYTITATNNDYESGGTVTTVATYASGNTITILRSVPITQESDFTENMRTLYETFEDGLDKNIRIAQQQQEEIDRSVKIKKTYSPSTYTIEITPEASKVLGWNSGGTALTNYSTTTVYATRWKVLNDDYDNSLATAYTDIGSDNVTILIDRDTTVSSDLTLGSNIELAFINGAQITISTGKTLTIYSPANIQAAPNQQIVSGAGLLRFTVPGNIRPEMWQANTTPGTTDMTDAINTAIECIRAGDNGTYVQGSTLLLQDGGIYLATDTIWAGGETSNTGVRAVEVEGGGKATIHVKHTGIGWDWTGTHRKNIRGVQFYGDTTTSPSILMLLSRRSHDIGGGLTNINNCLFLGEATVAGLYNYASEEMHMDEKTEFRVDAPYQMVITKSNVLSVTIPYEDGTLASESATNFFLNDSTFYSMAASGTAVNSVLIEGAYTVHFDKAQFHDEAEDISLVRILQPSGGTQPYVISFKSCLFHDTYLNAIEVSGNIDTLIVDESNRFSTATGSQIKAVTNGVSNSIKDSYLVANSVDFSLANFDMTMNNVVKIVGATGSFSINRAFQGDLYHRSDATITITTPAQFDGRRFVVDTGAKFERNPDLMTITGVASSGTGEDTLMTETLAANYWMPYEAIRIIGGGDVTNANGNKTIKLYIGTASYTIVPAENLASTSEWNFDVTIMSYSTSAQKGGGWSMAGSTSTLAITDPGDTPASADALRDDLVANTIPSIETNTQYKIKWMDGNMLPGQDLTAALTIKVTGECAHASDIITQRFMYIMPQ